MSDREGLLSEPLRIILPLVILAVGAGTFVVLLNHREVVTKPPEEPAPPRVQTTDVLVHDDALVIEVDGQVVPYREISLSAEVAGRVIRKEDVCRPGKYVHKDQLLLEIDPEDYQLEMRRLNEEVAQAQTALKELEVEVENTQQLIQLTAEELELQQNELNRQLSLAKRGVSTASVLDEAKKAVLKVRNAKLTLESQLNVLNTRRTRMQSGIDLTLVKLEKAKLDLQRTQVTAPIDGMVVTESVEVDSYVQKGTPLVIIEDTSAVEVKCNLRMDELYWIWNQADQGIPAAADVAREDYQIPNTDVNVTYRLGNREYQWKGKLWRYDGIGLDERTRTVPCRVLVQAPRDVQLLGADADAESLVGPPALVRGMFVTLEILAKPRIPLLQVPEEAVQPGNMVWRVRENRLNVVAVEVVEIINKVAILRADASKLQGRPKTMTASGGAARCDRVVVTPLAEVHDGMTVRTEQARTSVTPPGQNGGELLAREDAQR